MSRRHRPLLPLLTMAVLLAGCGSLGGPEIAVQVYSPQVSVKPDPSWPQAGWQLSVAAQAGNQMLDSARIAVRPTPNELKTYKGALWADDAPEMLETAVIEAFEDSGRIQAVGRFGGGSRGDVGLFLEVRSFESVYRGGTPEATIEVQARLVDLRGDGIATRRFNASVPGAGAEVPQMVDAFGAAMSAIGTEIVGWSLVEGNRLRAGDATSRPASTPASAGE